MDHLKFRPYWLNISNNLNQKNFNSTTQNVNNRINDYISLDNKKYILNFEQFLNFIKNDKFDIESCNINNKNFKFYNDTNNSEEYIDYDELFDIWDEYLYIQNLENQEDVEEYLYEDYEIFSDSESYSDTEDY